MKHDEVVWNKLIEAAYTYLEECDYCDEWHPVGYTEYCQDDRFRTHPEGLVDLWLAAPDLLEAVEELTVAWNTWARIDRECHGNHFDSAVGMAREAIKKARGEG